VSLCQYASHHPIALCVRFLSPLLSFLLVRSVRRTLYYFLLFLLLLKIGFQINQHPIIVSSAADEISGETVAIKMVTRVFAKATLAKRALRELALLRHFNNHENITGLIDVDGIAETFNEM